MSILLRRKEYLKKEKEIFLLENAQKQSTDFENKNFKESSFYHYKTNLGISYMYFNSSFEKNIVMECKHEAKDVSFIMFNYSKYETKLLDYDKKNEYIFKPEYFVIGKVDENFQSYNKYLKNKNYCTHYILFENKIFNELLKKDDLENPIFEIDGFLINNEMKINEKQKFILEDIPTLFSLEGKLQELYLESKIIDLIYITINGIKSTMLTKDLEFSSKDIKSLHKAKNILINNISNPPSLKMLAYQATINEFKLKKGFKQLFGNTVFGFLQEYRLNEAKRILANNEININEVCNIVGYKSVSHFSKIFKDHFGINPIEIRKTQKRIYI